MPRYRVTGYVDITEIRGENVEVEVEADNEEDAVKEALLQVEKDNPECDSVEWVGDEQVEEI